MKILAAGRTDRPRPAAGRCRSWRRAPGAPRTAVPGHLSTGDNTGRCAQNRTIRAQKHTADGARDPDRNRRSRTTTPVGVGHVMLSVLVTRRAREPPICTLWQGSIGGLSAHP